MIVIVITIMIVVMMVMPTPVAGMAVVAGRETQPRGDQCG